MPNIIFRCLINIGIDFLENCDFPKQSGSVQVHSFGCNWFFGIVGAGGNYRESYTMREWNSLRAIGKANLPTGIFRAEGIMAGSGSGTETAKLLRDRYSPIARDENEKIMDGIEKLLASAREPAQSPQTFLEEAGRTIHRLFDFREIAIGLKSKRDGLFRYEVLIGFSDDAEKARRRIAYTYDEMTDASIYPGGVRISKLSEFMLTEFHPYKEGEEETFNRPNKLAEERKSADQLMGGDYIDVYIAGRDGGIIGWMEFSATRNGMMPSRIAIRWLELLAAIIGSVITEREADKA